MLDVSTFAYDAEAPFELTVLAERVEDGVREHTPPEAWVAMLAAEAPYDAHYYIGQAAPASLFIPFARHDDFVPPDDAAHYVELASDPKQIAWYDDCNHELNAQARIDRAIFLCEQLGMSRPPQHTLDRLQAIPPPVPIGQ